MAAIDIAGVAKSYGPVPVLRGIDLSIADGEFVVLVGPSGCGKSTLLRLIAGLEPMGQGEIRIGGRRVNELPPKDRDLAMVFQSYALYPHMTVADNMSYALRLRKTPKERIGAALASASSKLGLEKLVDRKPRALSGGQRQRVAMGRAIVRHPQAFLFDEPLSNLDARLREQMRFEIRKLHRDLGATSVYVTHDQIEAMTMADRIVVLRAGKIEQVGTPLELYHYPANTFVAGFIGSPKMNLTPVTIKGVDASGVTVTMPGGGEVSVPVDGTRAHAGAAAMLGVRPEHFAVASDGPIGGRVAVVEQLGGETLVYVDVGNGTLVTVKGGGALNVPVGTNVRLSVSTGEANLFDKEGLAMTPKVKHDYTATKVH